MNSFVNNFKNYSTEYLLGRRALGDQLSDEAHQAIEKILIERNVTLPPIPKESIDVNNNGQCDLYEITGCTNADACNYNPAATFDDGSCGFDTEETIEVAAGNLYEWNGTVYTESGIYEFSYESAAGCDSVVILDLTITSVLELEGYSLAVWPNPANQEVQVTINGVSPEVIEVFDVTGKHIVTYTRLTRLDVSGWASGSYMLRVRNDQAVMERRLMVVR